MIKDLFGKIDDEEFESFLKHAGVTRPEKYTIAEKNRVLTNEHAVSMSKTIAAVHSAFSTIKATTENSNRIEKARLKRLETSTKEAYMETRSAREQIVTSGSGVEIKGIVRALGEFNNLLIDLDKSMRKLDLSCNICVQPCDPSPVPTPVPVREKTKARSRVSVPVSIPNRQTTKVTTRTTVSLPAPPRATTVKAARATPQLAYQPLPSGEALRQQIRQPQKAAVPVGIATDTIDARFRRGEITREQAIAETRALKQQARQVGAQLPVESAPKAQPGRPRWTANIGKEEYFDDIRSRQGGSTRSSSGGGSVSSGYAPRGGFAGAFGRTVTAIAESPITKWGGRVLGVVGTGADVYTRKQEGQSWGQVASGVGGGLAGAAAGGKIGAAAGGALGAGFFGIGAVPGAFIGGLIGSGIGYFGGSKAGDAIYNKVQSRSTPTDQNRPKQDALTKKALGSLTAATKKVAMGAAARPGAVMGGAMMGASLADKFADFLENAIKSVTSYVSNMPSAFSSSVGNVFDAFTTGWEGLPPAGSTQNAQTALAYFMSKGWTREQAAGIVGNLQAESTAKLDPNALGDQGNAWGVAQWNKKVSPDRVANFRRVIGTDLRGSSLEQQLAFVNWELNNTEKAAGDALRRSTTAQEAAVAMAAYERYAGWKNPSTPTTKQRIANAVAMAGGFGAAAQTVGLTLGGAASYVADQASSMFKNAQFVLPVGNARISSGFGNRTHPVYGGTRFHNGVDFAVGMGTPIRAIQGGIVNFAESRRGGGWSIGISHPGGWYSGYAHLSKFLVSQGMRVDAGQIIGLSGGDPRHPGAGSSTGPHLHFTLSRNGSYVNPAQHLSGASQVMNPERGNQATEREVIRKTPSPPPVPGSGRILEDIVTGRAIERRRAGRPRFMMAPQAGGQQSSAPFTLTTGTTAPPKKTPPNPAAQYRKHLAG